MQTNPSQQELGRMSVRLRQLSTNLGRVRDYLDPQQFNQARNALNALQHSIDNSVTGGTGNNSGFNTTSTTAPLMSRPLVNRPSLGHAEWGSRGRPARPIDRERLEQLRTLGFSISYIAREGLLGGTVHHNTLRRFIRANNMPTQQQRCSAISDEDLEQHMTHLNQQFPNAGADKMLSHLQTQNPPIRVQWIRCRRILLRVDPVGTVMRFAQAIQRRQYSVPTPNSLWHVDTNHALIRY